MLIHWDQSILNPYIYLQFRLGRECFDVQKMKKSLIIRLKHFPKINPTSNGGKYYFWKYVLISQNHWKQMFPAALGKNDAFGSKSVNHNSAMHGDGYAKTCTRSAEGNPKSKSCRVKRFELQSTNQCIMTLHCTLHPLHASRCPPQCNAAPRQRSARGHLILQSNAVKCSYKCIGAHSGESTAVSRSVDRSPIVGRTSALVHCRASQTHWK